MNCIDVYLIRHPECKVNQTPGFINGRSNHSPVTDLGKKQTLALLNRLKKEDIFFDEIHSSPAERTMHIAKLFVDKFENIIIDENLQELDQGEWTGKERIKMYTPEIVEDMNKDHWNFKAPGGESQNEVSQRGMKWAKKYVVDRLPKLDKDIRIAVFTHGVFTKCFLANTIGLDKQIAWKTQIDNTSITHLKYDGSWSLVKVNDSSHINELKV